MKRTSTDIPKASKEVLLEASKLSNPAARFLVANYYDAQEARKRVDMQLRHLGEKITHDEIVSTLDWTASANANIEGQVLRCLKKFAEGSLIGRWCLEQHGVGPVLAAGFIANIDIEIAQTAGQVWRFAGMDPSCKWEKGEKRPYNAGLKQLCFHFGECAKRTAGKARQHHDHRLLRSRHQHAPDGDIRL